MVISILKEIFEGIITPQVIVILSVLFVSFYLKNKRIEKAQKQICGDSISSATELTLSQFIFGFTGGVIGSLILKLMGVHFSEKFGIQILILISIILSFINSKYICFSYSGAILGIYNIIFSHGDSYYDSRNIILFIAVLHIIEGILIIFDGDKGIMPIFKENEDGKVIGGYLFKRYWVIVCAIIMANSYLYIIICAISGFSTTTFTRSKKEKAISSGMFVFGYGAIMVMVANLCKFGYTAEIIALIIMVIMHESMMKIQRIIEKNRDYKFISDDNGLIILEVSKKSKLKDFGVQIGDKILNINNEKVNSKEHIYEILNKCSNRVKIEIVDLNGKIREIEYDSNNEEELGIVVVPKKLMQNDNNVSNDSFNEILKKAKANIT